MTDNSYRTIQDIRPVVQPDYPIEDTSTEGGALRYTLADLEHQIAAAHFQLFLFADTLNIHIPRYNHQNLEFTPAARLTWLREHLRNQATNHDGRSR